jgi:hypothetical protein
MSERSEVACLGISRWQWVMQHVLTNAPGAVPGRRAVTQSGVP